MRLFSFIYSVILSKAKDPKPVQNFYVYILKNIYNRVLYIGMTNDLERRFQEHRQKLIEGFTKKYNVTKLVYYEHYSHASEAIAREKQLKGWLRRKKIALIETMNPMWQDLES